MHCCLFAPSFFIILSQPDLFFHSSESQLAVILFKFMNVKALIPGKYNNMDYKVRKNILKIHVLGKKVGRDFTDLMKNKKNTKKGLQLLAGRVIVFGQLPPNNQRKKNL